MFNFGFNNYFNMANPFMFGGFPMGGGCRCQQVPPVFGFGMPFQSYNNNFSMNFGGNNFNSIFSFNQSSGFNSPMFNNPMFNAPALTMPDFSSNFTFKYDFGSITNSTISNPIRKTQVSNLQIGTKNNLPALNEAGYNANKGQKLATTVLKNVEPNSKNLCSKYVSDALEANSLGNGQRANAFEMYQVLQNNKNFKEVKVSRNDFSKLPAGCIVVYDKGVAGYHQDYGHIEIALGNGKAASDFVTQNPRYSDKAAVFVPV